MSINPYEEYDGVAQLRGQFGDVQAILDLLVLSAVPDEGGTLDDLDGAL